MQAVTNPVATISLEEMVQQLDSLERYENISVVLIIYRADIRSWNLCDNDELIKLN